MTYLAYSHFDLNRKTVERIARGPECRKMVGEHASMAKAYAEALAASTVPRGDADESKHKHYHDSFEVSVTKVHGITKKWPMTRVAGRVANTARHAIVMEFGFERKNKAGDVVGEEPGHFILSDTLTWLDGFDTHRFFDEFDDPEPWDEFEHDGGSDMSYLDFR